ncbi:haloacid dehalogenase [Arthrobacter glacialis]|nr:haloacid dehalogenase [Arthrobacter glacialis]
MDVNIAATPVNRGKTATAVLFDLDGTLVDPAGGITQGIEYALRTMDLPSPGLDALNAMVGPKLADALVTFAGVPLDTVPAVIAAYRVWYGRQGMAMSVLYPGIKDLLTQLKAAGVPLAVATQKPEPLAKKLLALHEIDQLFTVIKGSHADETLMPGAPGYRAGKSEIIAAALTELSELGDLADGAGSAAVMVGDRHQDVRGAQDNGLDCIGVSWGFAADGELAAAGVTAVVHSADELAQELTQTFLEARDGAL